MKNAKRFFIIISSSFLLMSFSAISYLQAESRFPTQSAPGLYVNQWPAFSLEYPVQWQEKKPEPRFVFRAEAPEGNTALRISVIPGMDIPLENMSAFFLPQLERVGQHIEVLSDKTTGLEDRTPTREMEIEWEPYGGPKLNTLILAVEKAGAWIAISLSAPKGPIGENLRKIPYSLKIRPNNENIPSYKYSIPEATDDGWSTGHVTDVNMNDKMLTEMISKVLDGTYHGIHSALIVKEGKLVLEAYFPGDNYEGFSVDWTRKDAHRVMSVTKSFTATLIGIAIDKGFIGGTDEKLISFFPEYKHVLSEDNKSEIMLKHLLTMTAGLDWDETTYLYNDPRNPFYILLGPEKHNMINHILSRPMKYQSGSKFSYNSCLSMLLGVILEKRTGIKFTDFADQYLFEPMGITNYIWGYWDVDQKVPRTGGGLRLRPRDMAKLGYLYANKGRWHGRQIISSAYIEDATKEHSRFYPMWTTGYGYQWWLYRFKYKNVTIDGYAADGWGGQRIYVFPTLDLIVTFTAGNYSTPHSQVYAMMYSIVNAFILPAAISGK